MCVNFNFQFIENDKRVAGKNMDSICKEVRLYYSLINHPN